MGSSQRIEINKGNTKEEEMEKKNRNGAPKAYASFWRSLYSRFPPFYRLRMLKGKRKRRNHGEGEKHNLYALFRCF